MLYDTYDLTLDMIDLLCFDLENWKHELLISRR